MATPFKDEISPATIRALGRAVAGTVEGFDAAAFGRRARRGLADLELKARVDHVADALDGALRATPRARAGGLDVPDALVALADALDAADLGMWAGWPAVTWVERHGLDHPAAALAALGRMTAHASAEFAVRPYLEADADLVRLRVRPGRGHRRRRRGCRRCR